MTNIDEKEYFEQIKQLESDFKIISSKIQRTYPRANNLKSEKKKFLMAIADDKFYNPTFEFDEAQVTDEDIENLRNFEVDTSNDLYGFKKLYKELAEHNINWCLCLKNWGTDESSYYSIKFYGRPSFFLFKKAEKFCMEYKADIVKFKRLTPKKVANRLKKFTKELTGDKIEISMEQLASKVNISPAKKLIKVDPEAEFTNLDLKRLKAHEIGVHYMRYYNGRKFKPKILNTGTANYTEIEEGLAVYNEELKDVLSKAQMYIYSGRVIATYYSPKMDFYSVFEKLKELGFNDEVAFAITYRAKRNISDTSKKGGFTKDYVYFSGYHKVKSYAKRNDIKDLFIGKIKIEDIKVLRDYIDKNKDKIEFPEYDL